MGSNIVEKHLPKTSQFKSWSAPMAEGMLRLRRLAANRLLISRSVLSLPLRLFVVALLTLRLLVRRFKSAQFPLGCGFLERSNTECVMDARSDFKHLIL